MARKRVTIAGNTTTWLGGSYSADTASSMVLQLTAASSWDGSVTIVRRMAPVNDSTVGGASVQPAAVTVAYTDQATGTLAATAMTGTTMNKLVEVGASRSQIGVTTASRSVGSLIVDYDSMQG